MPKALENEHKSGLPGHARKTAPKRPCPLLPASLPLEPLEPVVHSTEGARKNWHARLARAIKMLSASGLVRYGRARYFDSVVMGSVVRRADVRRERKMRRRSADML
jgi:hypothetical protein